LDHDPFSYSDQDETYEGTIRVLYNPTTCKTEKVVLSISFGDGRQFSFYMQPENETINIKMFSSDAGPSVHFEKFLQELRIKLQNKGAKIDDMFIMKRNLMDLHLPQMYFPIKQ